MPDGIPPFQVTERQRHNSENHWKKLEEEFGSRENDRDDDDDGVGVKDKITVLGFQFCCCLVNICSLLRANPVQYLLLS